MIVSIAFLIATIVIYIWILNLRNLQGKCTICYLISLTFGYIILAFVELKLVTTLNSKALIYFSFMFAFNLVICTQFQCMAGISVCIENKNLHMFDTCKLQMSNVWIVFLNTLYRWKKTFCLLYGIFMGNFVTAHRNCDHNRFNSIKFI